MENEMSVEPDQLAGFLRGYRFSVCETRESIARTLAIRRTVYCNERAYTPDIPDEYDDRSWHFLAEHLPAEKAVGAVRVTARCIGACEADKFFRLPAHLATADTVEISRFAILPPYRRAQTFFPIVTFGLFRLLIGFFARIRARAVVISSISGMRSTYEWMGFRRSGLITTFPHLRNAEHELLWGDFSRIEDLLRDHPFRAFFLRKEPPEIVLPDRLPPPGLWAAFPQRS